MEDKLESVTVGREEEENEFAISFKKTSSSFWKTRDNCRDSPVASIIRGGEKNLLRESNAAYKKLSIRSDGNVASTRHGGGGEELKARRN